MEKSIANEILTALHESSYVVDKTLGELKGACPEEPFHACALLLGTVMSDMFDTVMAPIYDAHPDLAPDWYREGSPLGRPQGKNLKLPPEARQALLTAFETAYEKVQSAAGRLSKLSDPLEVAMYSQGFHQISVALCRARVTLLMAEPE
ncbi:hypothetical protein [Polyangium jinanense]|uniref:Uncharacterized protein n=1 Tax=Polyangium jinanense TaxID=2829994 RepID=A0A9X4AX04_9BACT|nr:hypothetical protein [Polyangium jinanense]MDC3962305.1 hypothetical protein [Polyangium jinanense]MDC3985820.1 hypothetical protein [Polyangium jinanense]